MARTRDRPPKVVGLGLCVVDHLYVVDAPDFSDERIRYGERVVSLGGMVANALIQAAAEGASAQLLSMVGDDADGRALRRALRRAGVETRRLLTLPGRPTRVAVMLVDRAYGERRFLIAHRGPHERGVPDFDLGPIQRGSVLLIDGHYAVQARRAVRRARDRGAVVVADFNRPTREVLALLRWVDYPVVPLEFARAYAGDEPRDTLMRLRDAYGGDPVVTLGARGALYFQGGRIRRHPARHTRVRDTTGAGDAFHGAFAAAIGAGATLAAAIERGTRAGARCCAKLGATGHLLPPAERVKAGRRANSPL